MGKCTAEIKKILFVFEDELTQVYIAINAIGDCPMGVQGWHHKTFPATCSALDVLELIKQGKENFLTWSLNAPL